MTGHSIHSEQDANQAGLASSAMERGVGAAVKSPSPRQPWARLLKAVFDLAGDRAELIRHAERDWASATFSGSRHTLTLRFIGSDAEAGEAFIAALPDHAFTIPRWLVADAQVVAVKDTRLPQRELVVEVKLLLLDRA